MVIHEKRLLNQRALYAISLNLFYSVVNDNNHKTNTQQINTYWAIYDT